MSGKQINVRRVGSVLGVFVLIGAGLLLVFKESEIARPPSWPPGVKRYLNSVTSRIRVVDAETGETLFYYHDDPAVYPVQFERVDDRHWRVTFERRPK
jgi:hypothetical protein